MSNNNQSGSSGGCGCTNVIPSLLTAMVGYHIHGSMFFAVLDFIFWPIAIVKWIICQEITLKIIKETFAWFFN